MLKKNIGKSVSGKDLTLFEFQASNPSQESLLFIAGVHGNEIEGVWLLEHVRSLWEKHPPQSKFNLLFIPELNPDGVAIKTRLNANGVDLNRNLPTKDWTAEILNPKYPPGKSAASEPENKVLIKLIEERKPKAILSCHSFEKPQVNSNGPARAWADELSKLCGHPVTEDIGYPTPGSLGTYAGKERGIPTITLEILRGLEKKEVLEKYQSLLLKTAEFFSLLP